MRAAAVAANADEFIRELPDGYDTEVGEGGGRLSGGQRWGLAPLTPLLNPLDTPHATLLHPYYTPYTLLVHPSCHPLTPVLHPLYTAYALLIYP